MNDLNIPAKNGQKICSACLRLLPLKYFLRDGSRVDGLCCNCNSCLFPDSTHYQANFPELYQPDRFPKVNPDEIPRLSGIAKRLRDREKLATGVAF